MVEANKFRAKPFSLALNYFVLFQETYKLRLK